MQASVDDLKGLVSEKIYPFCKTRGLLSWNEGRSDTSGQINPPSMRGNVSGNLKCKRTEVTVATLNTAGTLSASSSSTTATGPAGRIECGPDDSGNSKIQAGIKANGTAVRGMRLAD